MSNIKATVTPQNNVLKSRITPQQNFQVTEYKVNTSSINLGDLFNVDTSAASDGAVLVFNGNTETFEATTEIKNENTQVNGGHY